MSNNRIRTIANFFSSDETFMEELAVEEFFGTIVLEAPFLDLVTSSPELTAASAEPPLPILFALGNVAQAQRRSLFVLITARLTCQSLDSVGCCWLQ